MKPISLVPDSEVAADWFSAHPLADRSRQLRYAPSDARDLISLLWPVSTEYFSPLSPVFLTELPTVHRFRERSSWMVRDGLVPLLWFFKSNPRPPARKAGVPPCKLWIDRAFADFVPEAWRSSVGGYRLCRGPGVSRPRSPTKPKALLVTGLMMPVYCGLDSLQTQLDEIVERYGRRALATMEILAFLPASFLDWGTRPQHEYHSEYMLRVCRTLGTRIRPISWTQLDAASSFEGFDLVDLNEGLLCRDSALLHLAMSRGARLAFETAPLPKERYVAISPSHGFGLSERLPAARSLKPALQGTRSAFERFENAMQSDANRRFPWPRWIPAWARMAIKG